jgi:hypothetical protein
VHNEGEKWIQFERNESQKSFVTERSMGGGFDDLSAQGNLL